MITNTKFATAVVIAAAALGASSSFAFGTSHDNGAWSAGNGSPVALNPNGDDALPPSTAQRLVTRQPVLATSGRGNRFGAG